MGRPQIHFEGDICSECGENPVASNGYGLNGVQKWRATCGSCHKASYERPWLKFRGAECEMCGHKPMYLRALEVHHRDGDKSHNEDYNLTTLCANCHRDLTGLIGELDGDWEKAEPLYKRFIKSLFS